MMDSVSRSMMTLNAYLPNSTPPFDLVEHYVAKKTYYPTAINRVLGVLDRGYKHRVTFNGEIGRNYDDLRDRWNEIQCQMAKMDESLNDLEVTDGVTDMSRQVKGLSLVTETTRPRSLLEPMSVAVDLQSRLQRVGASIRRILEVLHSEKGTRNAHRKQRLRRERRRVGVSRNVSYCPDRTVLDCLSFSLHRGEKVALVGVSGCGKSTIGLLATRLYDPNLGSVLIDGIDLRDLGQRNLRSIVTIVPQRAIPL